MLSIKELTEYGPQVAEELDALMRELSPGAMATDERVRRVVEDPNMHQYAAFRGRHIGRMLMERMVADARGVRCAAAASDQQSFACCRQRAVSGFGI